MHEQYKIRNVPFCTRINSVSRRVCETLPSDSVLLWQTALGKSKWPKIFTLCTDIERIQWPSTFCKNL